MLSSQSRFACALVTACLCASSLTSRVKAESITGSYSNFNNGSATGGSNPHGSTPPGNTSPFSGSGSGPWSNVSVAVSYGAAVAQADLAIPAYSYFNTAYAGPGASGQWADTVTINNSALTGQTGVLHTAFHFTGSFSVDQDPLPWGHNEGYIYVDGNTVAQVGYDWYTPYAYDTVPAHYATIPYDRTFVFGQPFDMGAGIAIGMVASNYGGNNTGAVFHASESLRGGGFTVTDQNGNPLGFSSTSHSGSAAGANVPVGGAYAGFSVSNDANVVAGHGTVMNILDGSASGDSSLSGTFIAGDPSGASLFHSDIVDFKGTNHDKFVLEMSYDPAGVANESALVLGWKNPATGIWENAINGNSDGGAGAHHVLGAYVSPDDFVLSYYGVDTINHVVWAVVDHNSEFAAVTASTPEPTGLLLLAAAMLWLPKRTKH
jgi:hypothetical protein